MIYNYKIINYEYGQSTNKVQNTQKYTKYKYFPDEFTGKYMCRYTVNIINTISIYTFIVTKANWYRRVIR